MRGRSERRTANKPVLLLPLRVGGLLLAGIGLLMMSMGAAPSQYWGIKAMAGVLVLIGVLGVRAARLAIPPFLVIGLLLQYPLFLSVFHSMPTDGRSLLSTWPGRIAYATIGLALLAGSIHGAYRWRSLKWF